MRNKRKIWFFVFCFSLAAISASAQKQPDKTLNNKPALVVGIVVDQMRYDLLFRFWDKYSNGGFKRLVNGGFLFTEANYNYVPTYTGPGHACIYTGTTPAVNGIVSNEWFDRATNKSVYCVDDSTVSAVGAEVATAATGKMSPKNLLSTTVTDELRMATNFNSKVIGIALKDRGAILPAGHSPIAAYWHDPASNHWITSTYYMKELPRWVADFNEKKLAETYLSKPWETLLPIDQYTESAADDNAYEGLFKTESKPVFPHDLLGISKKEKELIRKTPFGNTFTEEFAKAAIEGEQLGKSRYTDFLCVSFSSTDYVGHQFGPNAIELEDTYIRLDRDLSDFFNFIDAKVGKGNYLLFLTADHGAATNPLYSKDHNMPGGHFETKKMVDSLKAYLNTLYDDGDYLSDASAHDIYFNERLLEAKKITTQEIRRKCAVFVKHFDGVAEAFTSDEMTEANRKEGTAAFIKNGFYQKRSPDVMIELQPGWIEWGASTGTTHGSGYSYDTHVPVLFYGWKIPHGQSARPVAIEDIAPTVANLLGIESPSGTTGHVLIEVINK